MENNFPKTTLGKYRMAKNLTQRKLAFISGVSIRTIQRYELKQENIEKADWKIIWKLAEVLDIDPMKLFTQGLFNKNDGLFKK